MLPKDGKLVAQILDEHVQRERERTRYRRVTWLLAWYYFNGYRRFDVFNPETGELRPHYLDEEGAMEYQSQELLSKINDAAGRLGGMDARPKVARTGLSLPTIRDRAVMQVLMDSAVGEDHLRDVKRNFAWNLACLGCCGIAGNVEDSAAGLVADMEVVHPRELFPFPTTGVDHTKARGLVRERVVPLSFLQEVFGDRIKRKLDDMEWYETIYGEEQHQADTDDMGYHYSHREGPMGGGGDGAKEKEHEVVRVRELWLNGVRDEVSRYVVCSGDAVLEDRDYGGQLAYCPVGVARFMDNGTWHGVGMFDLLYSVHRQFEMLCKSLFNNIRDMDRYGVLVLPQGEFNENQLLKDVGRGLKAMYYEPDPTVESFRPFNIAPATIGDVPGRTAQFAKEIMGSVSPLANLVEEKGRIDSAAGLQFLDEAIREAITGPTQGVIQAWGTAYRGVAQQLLQQVVTSDRAVPLSQLTTELAGVIIDPESGQVSFSRSANKLPDLKVLSFGIQSLSPQSAVARKQEALEMWEKGLEQDPIGFRLFALKEGLDFAMWLEEEREPYESCVRDILMLYGDGQTPGEIVLTPHSSKPELQLRVVSAFMSGVAMKMASPEVQDAFMSYSDTLRGYTGMVLPAGIPNPDDAAMLSASLGPSQPDPTAAMEAMGGMGGMGPAGGGMLGPGGPGVGMMQ